MNLVLGVCGSISAYKAYELLRMYYKEDINIKVILTKGAKNFVNANILKSLGAQEVHSHLDDFLYQDNQNILHIDLVKWMDKLVIVPASANTIAKISSGVCDDLLTSVFLANRTKPCHLYPAMNTQMLLNPITQGNLDKLAGLNNLLIHKTESGELACKDIGQGKLATVEYIFNSSTLSLLNNKNDKTVTITTGSTVAPIDTVRYVTNPSSGKTGIELAKEFLRRGYMVNLICGHDMESKVLGLEDINGLTIYHTKTAQDMLKIAKALFKNSNIYISAAAISDMRFKTVSSKIKKDSLNGNLEFERETDILKELSLEKENQIIIGFAAESNLDLDQLQRKKESKSMDILIANIVNNGIISKKKVGFGEDENEYRIIHKDSQTVQTTKKGLSLLIADEVENND